MSRRGFTLIELLVATSMLAVLVAGVAACLSTGLVAWGRGAAAADRELPWLALEQMAQELAQVPGGDAGRAFLVATDGELGGLADDTLVMSSASLSAAGARWQASQVAAGTQDEPAWEPVPTRQQIEYALDQGETPGLYWRSRAPAGADPDPEPGDWQLISPDVVGLDYEWFDGTDWLPDWDSVARGDENPLPLAARIVMTVERQDGAQETLETAVTLGARFDVETPSEQ